jgi:hypothetical protein
MSLRYYPSFRIKTNLITQGTEYSLNGAPYAGKYYATYDGRYFSGPNPVVGPNEPLEKIEKYTNERSLNSTGLRGEARRQFAINTKSTTNILNNLEPTTYYPKPLESDYRSGYFYRYFVKKINDKGYVKEISQDEYLLIDTGDAPYDVSYYQIASIMWKLTGPQNTVRLSQYDIRAGIIDTNKRLTENLEKTFLGIKAFIGEDYSKFSRPTTTQ